MIKKTIDYHHGISNQTMTGTNIPPCPRNEDQRLQEMCQSLTAAGKRLKSLEQRLKNAAQGLQEAALNLQTASEGIQLPGGQAEEV